MGNQDFYSELDLVLSRLSEEEIVDLLEKYKGRVKVGLNILSEKECEEKLRILLEAPNMISYLGIANCNIDILGEVEINKRYETLHLLYLNECTFTNPEIFKAFLNNL